MTDEMKKEFTLRISNANKSELIVILYDMFEVYADEAYQAGMSLNLSVDKQDIRKDFTQDNKQEISLEFKQENKQDIKQRYKDSIRKTRAVLSELINSLNLEYEIAANIYSLYRYIERLLIKADVCLDPEQILQCLKIVHKLNESYKVVSSQDKSAPVMENVDVMYAGITYGRSTINENMNNYNRGLYV